jgi:hypothetical protein
MWDRYYNCAFQKCLVQTLKNVKPFLMRCGFCVWLLQWHICNIPEQESPSMDLCWTEPSFTACLGLRSHSHFLSLGKPFLHKQVLPCEIIASNWRSILEWAFNLVWENSFTWILSHVCVSKQTLHLPSGLVAFLKTNLLIVRSNLQPFWSHVQFHVKLDSCTLEEGFSLLQFVFVYCNRLEICKSRNYVE